MKPKTKRMFGIIAMMCSVAVGVSIILWNFKSHLEFFYIPSKITHCSAAENLHCRVGGLVVAGSIQKNNSGVMHFDITDYTSTLAIEYSGVVPALFREGQGVVARGQLNEAGVFIADELLAKHDERYMPPEIARSIKKSGQWKEGAP